MYFLDKNDPIRKNYFFKTLNPKFLKYYIILRRNVKGEDKLIPFVALPNLSKTQLQNLYDLVVSHEPKKRFCLEFFSVHNFITLKDKEKFIYSFNKVYKFKDNLEKILKYYDLLNTKLDEYTEYVRKAKLLDIYYFDYTEEGKALHIPTYCNSMVESTNTSQFLRLTLHMKRPSILFGNSCIYESALLEAINNCEILLSHNAVLHRDKMEKYLAILKNIKDKAL